MIKLFTDIERLGLASLGELEYLGHPREWVRTAVTYGSIIRVRKGRYARVGEDDDVIRAWRVGGRLACASAVAFHTGAPRPAELHVEVPANSAHLRSPRNPRVPLQPADGVTLHWARRPARGDRRAVALHAAEGQARQCRSAGQAAVSSVSASKIV